MSTIVVEGNAAADAELRITRSGKPVARVTVLVTDRIKDGEDVWSDAATSAYQVVVWGTPAEGFAEAAVKGVRLVAAGDFAVVEYTDRDGKTRTSRRITADHVGVSTRFLAAVVPPLEAPSHMLQPAEQ